MTSDFSKYSEVICAVLDYFLHFIIISIIFARSDGDNDRNMRMRCAFSITVI